MTYVRRDSRLITNLQQLYITRDILWLTVNNVTIVNIHRRRDYDVALNMLLQWATTERLPGSRRPQR